ncbi:MAG: hypothetical protein PQ612_06070 [Rickettsiales bacterium]|nr:hypothetical protein [Pseudomonadota bacterium]MDA0966890.1 hypothetical protein [Pseudomonadota bacterium]MDG4543565.1 hypothetical protein [Rickettsiales bacterium]MDG4545713.1 hypothetical protein [Rickettsiales bacterium]MDG4547514.1 hypothetical protein [Rickettsiales bacterium]
MNKLTNQTIITYKNDFSVSSIIFPSKSQERYGKSIFEVAVKSIEDIRILLDRIMLGVSDINELITYEIVDEKVEPTQELVRKKINGIFTEVIVYDNLNKIIKVQKPNYSKISSIQEQVDKGNITVNYLINPENQKKEYYTEETALAFLNRNSIEELKNKFNFAIINRCDLPKDYAYYFDSLFYNKENNVVLVDISKARAIKLEKIRLIRNRKLEELDKDLIVAERDKNKAKIKELMKKRQILLDVPQECQIELNNLSDFEEIKKLSHPVLEN